VDASGMDLAVCNYKYGDNPPSNQAQEAEDKNYQDYCDYY